MDLSIRLPAEIRELICHGLGTTADKAALALSCKGFHQIATRPLYEAIVIQWKGTDESKQPDIHLLLRTIIRDPSVAGRVKTLQCLGERPDYLFEPCFLSEPNGRTLMPPGYTAAELDHVSAIVADVKLPPSLVPLKASNYRTWETGIRGGEAELWQALLISQLPHLHTLVLRNFSYSKLRYHGAIMRHWLHTRNSMTMPGFTRLRHAEVCADIDHDVLGWGSNKIMQTECDDILPFFYLPKLQSLQTIMPYLPSPSVWETSMPGEKSHISKLHTCLNLHDGNRAELKPLGQLLSHTPSLQYLEIDICCHVESFDFRGEPYLTCNELYDALTQVRQSLTTLKLHFQMHNNTWNGGDDEYIVSAIGGLADFSHLSRLTTLEAPMLLLLGPKLEMNTHLLDRLPLCLSALALSDDMSNFDTYRWDAAAVLRTLRTEFDALPSKEDLRLKTLRMCLRDNLALWEEHTETEFLNFCKIKGLEGEFNKEIKQC